MSAPLIVPPPPDNVARLRFVTDGSNLLAEAIRFDTMAIVSHVEAILPDCIIGAYGNGVVAQAFDFDTGSTSQIFVDIQLWSRELNEWRAYLKGMIGTPYDYAAIAGFVTHTDQHEKNHVICSALQTLALRHVGFFSRPLFEPAHMISPRDLLLMLSARNEPKIHSIEMRAP